MNRERRLSLRGNFIIFFSGIVNASHVSFGENLSEVEFVRSLRIVCIALVLSKEAKYLLIMGADFIKKKQRL